MNAPNKTLLTELGETLRVVKEPAVAVLVGGRRSSLMRVLGEVYPTARLSQHAVSAGTARLHVELAAHGAFDLIVDDTRHGQGRSERFRDLFFHLKPGGTYLVRNFPVGSGRRKATGADPSVLRLVWRLLEMRSRGVPRTGRPAKGRRRQDARMLAASIGRVVVTGRHLLVENRTQARAKLSEEEMNDVLTLRDESSGRLLALRPPVEFRSRCAFSESPSPRNGSMPTSFRVPAMSVREYSDVVCLPGQVVVQENLILPDTYRHNQRWRLANTYTRDIAPRFAIPTGETENAEELEGPHFYLDSEFRGHFGHAITEQLSRLWAWSDAKQAAPELKAVMALNSGRELAPFEIELFSAAGIDSKDLVFVRGPVRVETLVAATPMFSQPAYVHPDIDQLWARVSEALSKDAPEKQYPRKVFCSRRSRHRACHNAADVESMFIAQGFTVVYPEDFPLPEQVMIFRRAEVIAGFAGSALLNLCLSGSPKKVLIISSESYTARNEYLVASALGHEIHQAWCKPDIPMPERGWDRRAARSPFTFDFDQEGRYVAEVLAST